MSVTKFKMLSNRLKAVLIGSAIALIGVLAIAPAISLASAPQEFLPAPQLLKPKNGAKHESYVPHLTWRPVDGAVLYDVQIATDPDFLNVVYTVGVPGPAVNVGPFDDGDLYWKVATYDADYNLGDYSQTWKFTVDAKIPAPEDCAQTSTNSYNMVPVEQYDLDDPVRYAADNADKNASLRGLYTVFQPAELVDIYGPPTDDKMPPQIATLFSPNRVPYINNTYQVADWLWEPSPSVGWYNGSLDNAPVHAIGMETTLFEPLRSPKHGRNLGQPVGPGGAIVLYADELNITLKFTREDSVATGYTMHISNICVDPNLLALYHALDNEDRNSFGPSSGNTPRDGVFDYNLPGLKEGQVFGTSYFDYEVVVAIRDVGTFLDARARPDWWQIEPGGGN